MRDLLELVAKSLVQDEGAVSLGERKDGETTVYELRVAKEDLGRIIGKHGKTARAIRTLLSAAASRQGTSASVDIIE